MSQWDIHFTKFNIQIQFTSSGELPSHKVSMLRGGIGEMLLQENCLKEDRKCETCMFQKDCPVPRIYYHPLEITPGYVTERGSEGYLFECSDLRRNCQVGDTMQFQLLLFGEVIIYFSQILQAMFHLGAYGIGNEKLHFEIVEIKNQWGKQVFADHNFYLKQAVPVSMQQYLKQRKKIMEKVTIQMQTPWTQKYQGAWVKAFDSEAFVDAVYRRCYLLHCLEGVEMERRHPFRDVMRVTTIDCRGEVVYRESSRHEKTIPLKGIVGIFILENIPETFLPYLYVGELVHIGKNVTMGFGKYRILSE